MPWSGGLGGSTRRRRGAAAIEFALTLPILLTLAAGVADYGVYLTQAMNVQDAVREAGRAGVAAGTSAATTATTRVNQSLTWDGISTTGGTVSATRTYNTTLGGYQLLIYVDLPFHPVVGLVPTPDRVRSRLTLLIPE